MATPDMVQRDLALARGSLDVHRLALSGGEPLLNKDLPAIMDTARHSRISKEVMVLTNGLLLDRQKSEFWRRVDVLRISRYPGQLTDEQIKRFGEWTRVRGGEFMVLEIPEFYRTLLRHPRDDASAEQAFRKCPYFHKCSALYDRFYYPCPQAFFIPRLKQWKNGTDAIPLEGMSVDTVRRSLNSNVPLRSCVWCTYSTTGPWVQTTKERWVEDSSV
jgi:hypothetical protein